MPHPRNRARRRGARQDRVHSHGRNAQGSRVKHLAAGQSATAKVLAGVGAAAEPGRTTLHTKARYTSHGREHAVSTATTTEVVYSSLAASYNNVGVTDDADTASGDFDLDGASYSAQALAAAG